jgi:hypothetical protein
MSILKLFERAIERSKERNAFLLQFTSDKNDQKPLNFMRV